jgi:DNA-binding response OmpR family regulator
MKPAMKLILFVGADPAELPQCKRQLECSGFSVLTAADGQDGLELFTTQDPAAVVVDETDVRAKADDFTEAIKHLNPRKPVVIVSDSAAVTEKVRGLADALVLKVQAQLLAEKVDSLIRIRNHSHPQLDGKYVVFSNSSRHYLDCSDGVCELLGYTRMELTSMTIDQASYRPQRTSGLFEQYVQNGKLEGQYILRHKSGKPIFIQYRSEIFPDGCMAAVWQPVEDWKQLYQSAMLEFDRSKLRDRVETAQHAVEHRMRELGEATATTPEYQQLRDALSGLRVLARDIPQA